MKQRGDDDRGKKYQVFCFIPGLPRKYFKFYEMSGFISIILVILYEVSYLPQIALKKMQTLYKKNQQIKASKFLTRP